MTTAAIHRTIEEAAGTFNSSGMTTIAMTATAVVSTAMVTTEFHTLAAPVAVTTRATATGALTAVSSRLLCIVREVSCPFELAEQR